MPAWRPANRQLRAARAPLGRHFYSEQPGSYGYELSPRQGPAGKVVGHGGRFTGINANLDVFLDTGYIAVVMANYDGAGGSVDVKIDRPVGRIE